MSENIVPLNQLGMNDVPRVGGKNASLGEMISNLGSLGVEVPGGFATTAEAFNDFLDQAGIRDRIHAKLDQLDHDDVKQLAAAGKEIRAGYYFGLPGDGQQRQGCHRSGAFICNGGRPAGRLFRRAAGNLFEYQRNR
jgi:hypothetical protein